MELKQLLYDKMGLEGDSLKGRTAMVTGGAMGIGKQVAMGLGLLGAKVAVIDIKKEKATRLVDELRYMGAEALHITADISTEGQLVNAVSEIDRHWKSVDILVNNAAEAFIGSFEEETLEVWDRVFNTNIRYPAAAIKFLLPRMLENQYGVVVNIISLEGLAFSTAYSATKVGMRSLTTSMATEIGPDAGVSLFSFAPGIVDTPLVNNYFYTQLADRFGMTMQDIIDGVGGNPGYEGLMPAEHCGAAIVHSIVRADQYHGQMVSPFLSLAKAKVIDLGKGLQTHLPDHSDEKPDGLDAVNTSMKEYLTSVLELNQNLEDRIVARTRELTLANEKLTAAIAEVKQLSGLLPICSNCKGIRDDKGYWNQIEDYISTHTEAIFSHSICPKCAKKLYPDFEI